MPNIGQNCRISELALIADSSTIGDNCFVGPFTVIRPHVTIGNNSEIRAQVFVAEGARIGNHVKILQLSNIVKYGVVEDCVFMGVGTILTNTKVIAHMRDYEDICEPPVIRFGARIGAGVRILPGVDVARNSSIGTGAVVTKSTVENGLYVGVPARLVGEVPIEQRL